MKLKYIISKNTNPYENLAVEEWLTMHANEGDVTLFLWQNADTVVIGKNQNPWKECNVELMKADGIRLARRMSGGGAVFHDIGNLNFTFIARDDLYDVERQTEVVMQAVRLLGIDVQKTGRNDLTIDGRKFSGHAYYSSGGYNYHHGTLMLDVDCDSLTKYLNVSADKLKSKGVASVRSRVINIADCLDLHCGDNANSSALAELRDRMIDAMIMAFEAVYMSEAEEWARPNFINARGLDKLLVKYKSDEWIYGTKIKFTHEIEHRFPWGGVDIQLEVQGGSIVKCKLYSDALDTEMFTALSALLEGMPYDAKEIRALANSDKSREVLELIANAI